ncbi:MAG: AI-2E family transporter [Pseudomonadota bacterium]
MSTYTNDTIRSDLKSLRISATLLAILATFVVVYFARDLLLPVVVGFLLALTLSPVNRSMQRLGCPAPVSATLLVSIVACAVIAVVYFAGDTVTASMRDLPDIMRELRYKMAGVTDAIDKVKDASDEVEALAGPADGAPQSVVVEQPGLLNSAVTMAASTVTSIFVALCLALFLLASGTLFYAKLVRVFDTLSDKKRALSTVYDIERHVSRYLLTITAINAGLGMCVGLAMWLIGLPNAYIWGIAAFLLNYLPILGGLVGTFMVGVYAIISFDSLGYAMLAPLVYQVLTSSEAQFVTPYLVGRRLELNMVAVFLTVVLWAWLWGVAGALVAVPFLLVFKVVCDNVERWRPVGTFLGRAESPVATEPLRDAA